MGIELAEEEYYDLYNKICFHGLSCKVNDKTDLTTILGEYQDYLQNCKNSGEEAGTLNLFVLRDNVDEYLNIVYAYGLNGYSCDCGMNYVELRISG